MKAGGTGRLTLNLADWDGDGKLDLIFADSRDKNLQIGAGHATQMRESTEAVRRRRVVLH